MTAPVAISSDSQNVSPSNSQRILAQRHSKFKERSFATSKNEHIPLLESLSKGPRIILLGNSMIERMLTTGQSASLEPWPSAPILSDVHLESNRSRGLVHERLRGVFNAGVGGDKYENILYRLHGDEERQVSGLLDTPTVLDAELWFIHAGTNNLHTKRGLSDASVEVLRLMLMSILTSTPFETRILLSELFNRTDIAEHLVDEANTKLEHLVDSINDTQREPRLFWIEVPDSVTKEDHLDDHVHLNDKGYRVWFQHLLPRLASYWV